jgi:CxxC-x17-CxxC domain-containing protein
MDKYKKFGGRDEKRRGFGGRDGGRPSFGGRGGKSSFGGRDDRGSVTMHKVNCSECGKIAEVPFKPTGDKPVYCNDCFGDKRESPSKRFDTRFDKKPIANLGYVSTPRAESKPDPRITDLKMQIDALHSKIDRVIEMIRKEVVVPGIAPVAAPKPMPAPVSKASVKAKAVAKVVVKNVVKAKPTIPAKKVVAKTVPTKTKTVVAKKSAPKKVAKKVTKK